MARKAILFVIQSSSDEVPEPVKRKRRDNPPFVVMPVAA